MIHDAHVAHALPPSAYSHVNLLYVDLHDTTTSTAIKSTIHISDRHSHGQWVGLVERLRNGRSQTG